jgi:hypothetical protein
MNDNRLELADYRPSLFPFTKPLLEVDIQCRFDKHEARIGESDNWLKILGCGMVHPKVMRNCGLDPDEYQGFAWGLGIDRIAMFKYGMLDLRAFFEADVRWLSHYGFRPLDLPTLSGGGVEHMSKPQTNASDPDARSEVTAEQHAPPPPLAGEG